MATNQNLVTFAHRAEIGYSHGGRKTILCLRFILNKKKTGIDINSLLSWRHATQLSTEIRYTRSILNLEYKKDRITSHSVESLRTTPIAIAPYKLPDVNSTWGQSTIR